MVHVKFLCVHKKLRLKRMTPVLIRELTRRVNQQDLHQAVYTAVSVLPTPLTSCRCEVDYTLRMAQTSNKYNIRCLLTVLMVKRHSF